MKKVIIALTLILALSFGAFAQDYSLKPGYKGFFEAGFIYSGSELEFHTSQKYGKFGMSRIELTTSHGIQLNPYLFLGGGVSLDCYTESLYFATPLFVNARVTPLVGNITPFVDVKGGYSLGYFQGPYLSAHIGCRFGITRSVGINVGVGYTYITVPKSKYVYDPMGYYKGVMMDTNGFGVNVGFDF